MKLINGDSRKELKKLKENSIDSVVSDPPFEIKFMAKQWDNTGIAFDKKFWKEVLRVVKPGGHGLIFGFPRTHHRLMVAMEDAGWEIHDCLMWVFGSGFPKSHNISKGIDKKLGKKRKVIGTSKAGLTKGNICAFSGTEEFDLTTPSTDLAKFWDGWGTGLKSAYLSIILIRKSLSEKTIVDNVLKWGVGGINIDDCRIKYTKKDALAVQRANSPGGGRYKKTNNISIDFPPPLQDYNPEKGRWPANLIFSEEAGELLDQQSGISKSKDRFYKNIPYVYKNKEYNAKGFINKIKPNSPSNYRDNGGASRFFYCPKASKKERNIGCENLKPKPQNNHPTLKPIKLLKYLIRLISPPEGVILDPFMGSGSTGCAAISENKEFIGIEMNDDYYDIAKRRIKYFLDKKDKPYDIFFSENKKKEKFLFY